MKYNLHNIGSRSHNAIDKILCIYLRHNGRAQVKKIWVRECLYVVLIPLSIAGGHSEPESYNLNFLHVEW